MITYRITFTVTPEQRAGFLTMIDDVYLPALALQDRYLGAWLLAPYESVPERENVDFELEFAFASEADRQRWASSPEHAAAWAAATASTIDRRWTGFDVLAAGEPQRQ